MIHYQKKLKWLVEMNQELQARENVFLLTTMEVNDSPKQLVPISHHLGRYKFESRICLW